MLYLVKVGPDSLPDNDFLYLPCLLIAFPLSQGILFCARSVHVVVYLFSTSFGSTF